MTTAGNAADDTLATLYLRYDCTSHVLYGLVLTEDGYGIQQTRPEEAYLRIDGAGKLVSGLSGNDGTPPDFAWVDGDGTLAGGFEASAPWRPARTRSARMSSSPMTARRLHLDRHGAP